MIVFIGIKNQTEKIFHSPSFNVQMCFLNQSRWPGGSMMLGKLPVPGRPTIWMIVGQRPIALAVSASGGVWTF